MTDPRGEAMKTSLLAEYRRRAAIVDAASKRSAQMEREFLEKKVLNAQANEALHDFGHKRARFGEWLLQVSDDLIAECLQSASASQPASALYPFEAVGLIAATGDVHDIKMERKVPPGEHILYITRKGLPQSETQQGERAKVLADYNAEVLRVLWGAPFDKDRFKLLHDRAKDALRTNGGSAKELAAKVRDLLLQHWSGNPNWRNGQENTYMARIDILCEAALCTDGSRKAVLDEAAKVCDDYSCHIQLNAAITRTMAAERSLAATRCAALIRALAASPTQEQGK